MESFFTKKETQSKSRPDGKVYSCASCGLYKEARNPKMDAFGNFKKGIINIGNFPDAVDDKKGKQWQGKAGRLLSRTYRDIGIDLFEDCLNINAVNCYSNDLPSGYQIECCRSVIVQKLLDKHKPKVIVLFGDIAVQSFLGQRYPKDLKNINLWRGWMIPDQDYNAWVLPVFDPEEVLDNSEQVLTIWKNDLERVKTAVFTTFLTQPVCNIKYIDDLTILSRIRRKIQVMAFDYETTGLKPHAPGHRIICVSIATKNNVYVFMMPKTKKERQPFIDLLQDEKIEKMAHNMKFEDTWTRNRLRTEIKNWGWDSMIVAHLLDNRKGITSLKFQTYVNFGVIDYASDVTYYLQSGTNNGNAINRIQELLDKPDGEKTLLKYCALDSFYEYQLAMKQIKQMEFDSLPF